MVNATVDATEGLLRRPHRLAGVRAFVVVQLYVVTAYLSAAIVPYLWRHRSAPPTWMLIVPGWLLGVPGFGITVIGPIIPVSLALIGAGVFVRYYRRLTHGLRRWLV